MKKKFLKGRILTELTESTELQKATEPTGSRGHAERAEGAEAVKLRGQGRSQAGTRDAIGDEEAIVSSVNSVKNSAILRVARKLERKEKEGKPPRIDSFSDFLTHHAQVKSGPGYIPYHFTGREALRPIVERLDQILASGEPDVSLALCGGAQFGKTVLMLNLLVYLVAVRFRNVGYYLPDDDLVSGLVDGKLRPDVLDQIPWLARLIAVGKTLAPSGRAVNRKGAFLCTDGRRTALAFMRGLGKIPTSFSMDVVIQDEKDDLPEEHARFLAGRMTASNLRLSLIIGTQRYHGAGQNLAFTEGTQHIGLLTCPGCGKHHNPETQWPGICRLETPDLPASQWPKLTVEGHFAFENRSLPIASCSLCEPGQQVVRANRTEPPPGVRRLPLKCPSTFWVARATCCPGARSAQEATNTDPAAQRAAATTEMPIPYTPGQRYVLACPECGTALDRDHPTWHAQAPERAAQRKWSYRISQLLIPDIDLAQLVAAWQLAIRDPAHMIVFCTDRLALPKSSSQTLTPHDLSAARGNYGLLTGLTRLTGLGKADAVKLDGQVHSQACTRDARGNEETSASHVSASNHVNLVNHVQNSLRFGGLDMGDQCWFVARSVEAKAPHTARLVWIEPIAAERVRTRVPELFRQLGLSVLCVDAGPLRDLARDLTFILNELDEDVVPSSADSSRNIYFQRIASCSLREPGQQVVRATQTLQWHAASETWQNLRCAPVEFTQREGQGLRHKVARTQDGRIYPLLAANRDETIQRVIQELLPTDQNNPRLQEQADGTAVQITSPRFLLPQPTEATRAVLDLYERHLLAGSRQERSADGKTLRYLDKCENHFLLATAYAALAELLAPTRAETQMANPAFRSLPSARNHPRSERSVIG